MKRSDMIESMVSLYSSIPEGASNGHKMDILLGMIERLGIGTINWESEDEVS